MQSDDWRESFTGAVHLAFATYWNKQAAVELIISQSEGWWFDPSLHSELSTGLFSYIVAM